VNHPSGFVKVHIEDAAVLHVGGQQAQGIRSSLQPGDGLVIQCLTLVPCEKDVSLRVEVKPAYPC